MQKGGFWGLGFRAFGVVTGLARTRPNLAEPWTLKKIERERGSSVPGSNLGYVCIYIYIYVRRSAFRCMCTDQAIDLKLYMDPQYDLRYMS